MQTYDCVVNVGGSIRTEVHKHNVTAAEIAVLRSLHGDDAVTQIAEKGANDKRSHAGEIGRLQELYGPRVVGHLFGTAINTRLPVTIKQLPGAVEPYYKEDDEPEKSALAVA